MSDKATALVIYNIETGKWPFLYYVGISLMPCQTNWVQGWWRD